MPGENCIFCKIAQGKLKSDTIYEDNKTIVILDTDWAVNGHTLVIWKGHHTNAADLSKDEFLHFSKVFHKSERALLDILQKDKSVVLKTGGLVSHFHFHIYPINSDTSWKEIKDMFDKKTKYQPKQGEKEKLLVELKNRLK